VVRLKQIQQNQKAITPPKKYQKVLASNEKKHIQIMSRMHKNHNQKEIELELKDKKIARLLAEVARLKKCIHVSTLGLGSTKLKIRTQHLYTQKILKMLRLMQVKNLRIKRATFRLADLRRVNENQKKHIQELTCCRENCEELALLVKKAEATNKYLKRMVFNKTYPGTPTRYLGNSPRVFPRTYPGMSSSGLPFKKTKPLNPKASCFKSNTPRKYPSIYHSDDQKTMLEEQKGNHNQKPKKFSFFAAEMKRKFAEACREDKTSSSEILANVRLNVVLEKDNSVAVKVGISVTVTNASPRSDKAHVLVNKQTKSSNSFSQIAVPPLADVPHEDFFSPRLLDGTFSFSPRHRNLDGAFSFSPRHRHFMFPKVVDNGTFCSPDALSMNLKIVDDQKLDFAQAKHRDTAEAQALTDLLSAEQGGNINHAFGSHKLYSAGTIETNSPFKSYLSAVE